MKIDTWDLTNQFSNFIAINYPFKCPKGTKFVKILEK